MCHETYREVQIMDIILSLLDEFLTHSYKKNKPHIQKLIYIIYSTTSRLLRNRCMCDWMASGIFIVVCLQYYKMHFLLSKNLILVSHSLLTKIKNSARGMKIKEDTKEYFYQTFSERWHYIA
jgi:hypothetical protein